VVQLSWPRSGEVAAQVGGAGWQSAKSVTSVKEVRDVGEVSDVGGIGGSVDLAVDVVDRAVGDLGSGRRSGVLIRPRGAVVAFTVDQLTAELDRVCADGSAVVIDLSSVTAVDPAGLAVLAGRSQQRAGQRARCVLTAPSAAVRDLLAAPTTGGTRLVAHPTATTASWLTAHWS